MHCPIGYLPSLVKKKKVYGSKEFIVGKKISKGHGRK